MAGDQQAALYGQGCWQSGEGKNTYGTGAFLLFNAGHHRPSGGGGLLTTIACDSRGKPAYALEASIFIAGAAVQWLRDGLGLLAGAAETEAMATSLASNDGVYFVPALVGLGAPHWEPAARGSIFGLTRGTTRAHFARAALEAMAYGTVDVVETMSTHGLGAPARLRVDGGASANDWLMQFQADQLGLPVERPDVVETTALGAGGLAGLATGVWSSPGEFLAQRTFTRFEPAGDREDAAANLAGWRRAVRATLAWARDTCSPLVTGICPKHRTPDALTEGAGHWMLTRMRMSSSQRFHDDHMHVAVSIIGCCHPVWLRRGRARRPREPAGSADRRCRRLATRGATNKVLDAAGFTGRASPQRVRSGEGSTRTCSRASTATAAARRTSAIARSSSVSRRIMRRTVTSA